MKTKKKKRISAAGIVRFVQNGMLSGIPMMDAWNEIKSLRVASPRVWNTASDRIAGDKKFWDSLRKNPPVEKLRLPRPQAQPKTGVDCIADILKKHERESGSNIRELYSLAGKIAEIYS